MNTTLFIMYLILGLGAWSWVLAAIHSNRLAKVRPGRHQTEDMIFEAVNTVFYLIVGTAMVLVAFIMATNI